MAQSTSSATSFQSAAQIRAIGVVDEMHPSRAASAVVAAHLPLRRKQFQRPWARWNHYKLSLVHTHRTCGSRRELHQTDCLRCVERCGLLPLVWRLSKARNRLTRLLEISDVLHILGFCFRYTRDALNMGAHIVQQEIQQRVAFGWVDPIVLEDVVQDSDEEWTQAALKCLESRDL